MSLSRRFLLGLCAAIVLVGLSDVALAQKSRKPAPPKFQLQYFNVPGRGALMSAADINNLGQVVGYVAVHFLMKTGVLEKSGVW